MTAMWRSRAGENAVTPRTREGEADECAAMNGKEGETRTHASDLKKPALGSDEEGEGVAGGETEVEDLPSRERRRGSSPLDNGLARIQHTCTNPRTLRVVSPPCIAFFFPPRRGNTQGRRRTARHDPHGYAMIVNREIEEIPG